MRHLLLIGLLLLGCQSAPTVPEKSAEASQDLDLEGSCSGPECAVGLAEPADIEKQLQAGEEFQEPIVTAPVPEPTQSLGFKGENDPVHRLPLPYKKIAETRVLKQAKLKCQIHAKPTKKSRVVGKLAKRKYFVKEAKKGWLAISNKGDRFVKASCFGGKQTRKTASR